MNFRALGFEMSATEVYLFLLHFERSNFVYVNHA